MTDAFVGRQPIFKHNLDIHAYELLFRSSETNNKVSPSDGDQATAEVILNTFTDIGFERMAGPYAVYINCPRSFLLGEQLLVLPSERTVLEILEDVVVDDTLVTAVKALIARGYVFALDDFVYSPEWEPLIGLATVVKLDVGALERHQLEEHVRLLRPREVKLLAEKVETQEEFETFRALGFDYFQGYFLARPALVKGKRLSSNKLAILRLFAQLQAPDVDVDQLDRIVSQDVALSHKLLRYLNSAFFSLSRKLDSIRQAVVYLGVNPLKRWLLLIAMVANRDKPEELMRIALVRARMCERLCELAGRPGRETYFTAGLFSALEALMDKPMGEILEDHLPLSGELSAALLAHQGPLGEALQCALAYEVCRWPELGFPGLTTAEIRDAYTEAVDWSFQVSAELTAI